MYYSSEYKILGGPKGGSREPLEPPLPTGLYIASVPETLESRIIAEYHYSSRSAHFSYYTHQQ